MNGRRGINAFVAEYPTQEIKIRKVSVDSTADGQSLASLLGEDVMENLLRLTLEPASSGVFWKESAVSSSDAPLQAGSNELLITKEIADSLRFITASGTVDMTVIQEG